MSAKPLFIVKPFWRNGDKFYYVVSREFGRYRRIAFATNAEAREECNILLGAAELLNAAELVNWIASGFFVWTINKVETTR